MYLQQFYETIPSSFIIHVTHELVDVTTVFLILLISSINARCQLAQGSAIIDISNRDFREDIERARHIIMYHADVTLKEVPIQDKQIKANVTQPVLIVTPDGEQQTIQIGKYYVRADRSHLGVFDE
jgi:hypothetical protein